MKKILLQDAEYDFLLHCINEYQKISESKLSKEFEYEFKKFKNLIELEMPFYNIENNFSWPPTKPQMIKLLQIKLETKLI